MANRWLPHGNPHVRNSLASTPDERTVFTYDTLGRSSAVDEYAGTSQTRHTTYSYDPITGSLTLDSSPEGLVHHAYDPATGQLIRTWTDHDDTRYTYDKLGRMDHVTAIKLGDQTTDLVTDYQYDAAGNLHATTQENGSGTSDDVVTTYSYDSLNRLINEVTTRGGTTTLFSQQVVYDDNGDGQKASTLEHTTDGQTLLTSWTYDGDGRLLTETRDVGQNGQTGTGDSIVTYSFDLSGNRTKQLTDKPGTADDQTLVSLFNVRDQLTSTGVDANADGVPDAATLTTYTYDRNGSTLSETTGGATKKYTWDLRGRMSGLDANGDGDTADSGDATFTYDNAGVRVGKSVVGGATTVYLQDKQNPTGYSQVLEEKPSAGGTPSRSYVVGQDVLAQADGTSVRSFLYDGGGSTRALLDAAGQPVSGQVLAYDAFGNLVQDPAHPVTPATRLLYRGELFDATLGRYQLRARYYDPELGRFLKSDAYEGSSTDPRSLHKYAYTQQNPENISDPSGAFGLVDAVSSIGFSNVLEGISATFSTVLATNILRGALVSDISKDLPEPSGTWYWTNAGVSAGFGSLMGSVVSEVAINLESGDQVAGFNFGVSFTPSASGLIKSGGSAARWFLEQLPLLASTLEQVGDPGVVTTQNVRSVLNALDVAFRNFASAAGAMPKRSGIGLSLTVGAGVTKNAESPGLLTGVSAGGSAAASLGAPAGYSVGAYAEGAVGLNLHELRQSGAVYYGGGLSIGYGTSGGTDISGGVGISIFIPTNMPDWNLPGDL